MCLINFVQNRLISPVLYQFCHQNEENKIPQIDKTEVWKICRFAAVMR